MKRTVLSAAAAVLLGVTGPAGALITAIEVSAVEPFADGAAFGQAGAYERVRGVARGELDPADRRNSVIVNLDKAPRNARGRVEYAIDFYLLRPADVARGSGKILYDVTNRGRKNTGLRLMDAPLSALSLSNNPQDVKDVGNALFLRLGYTLVWSGWDPESPRSNNGMSMDPIVATNAGEPIVRVIRDEMIADTRSRAPAGKTPVRATLPLTHEPASRDASQARLTVRRGEGDPRIPVPASEWEYVGARAIALKPESRKPDPGAIYELHYPAKNPRVLGIGLAATRDFLSYLRNGAPDSIAQGNIRTVLGFGSSQSGRFLRDFVHLGFNQDESSRKVFDGILAHTAGAGGVFLNYEFGQPVRTNTQHEDHTFPENAFPFSTARVTDPVTGKTASLLRNDGFDPYWMETNTSTEYWQKGASLLVTDPLGTRDLQLPANARAYLIAGTQHGGTAWMNSTRGSCMNPRNPHSPNPALRALIVSLDAWASGGQVPPATRTPRIADRTLVAHTDLAFPNLPDVTVARRINEIGVLTDWIAPQVDKSRPYRPLVTQVNGDGNEIAGVQLPEIAVPLGTYTGWNLYRAPFPEGELCDRDGTFIPFAATRAEREAKNDPRPSLAERYGDHPGYVKRLTDAARALVQERLLLQEDAELIVARASSAETAKRFQAAP
jgi:hypothetical protein